MGYIHFPTKDKPTIKSYMPIGKKWKKITLLISIFSLIELGIIIYGYYKYI